MFSFSASLCVSEIYLDISPRCSLQKQEAIAANIESMIYLIIAAPDNKIACRLEIDILGEYNFPGSHLNIEREKNR